MADKKFDDGGPMYPSQTSVDCGDGVIVTDLDPGASLWDYYVCQAAEADIIERQELHKMYSDDPTRSMDRIEARSAFAAAMIAEKRRREGEQPEATTHDLIESREQIGWFDPGSKRFCYTDEKQHHHAGMAAYTTPVYITTSTTTGD